jgi:ribosome-binding factor A
LDAAANFMQRELRRRLTIRRTPELRFLKDTSLEKGARILELLQQVREDPSP